MMTASRIRPLLRTSSSSPICCTSTTTTYSTTKTTIRLQQNNKNNNGFSHESIGDYRKDSFLEDEKTPLYKHQSSLPNLPVPSIQETLNTFLPTALPLCDTEEEMKSLKEACEKFNEQALVLQERLEDRAKHLHDSSWLQEWWNTHGYLALRSSNVLHVSYFFRLPGQTPCDGVSRAAAIVHGAVKYARDILEKTKPADVLGRKKPVPLCSSQYKYLFSACRIPGAPHDTYRIYEPANHVVVAVRGQFYSIPVIDRNGEVISSPKLRKLLQDCCNRTEYDSYPHLGWLTTQDRDDWYNDYKMLQQWPEMKKALKNLQKSMFVICLDIDDTPEDDREMGLKLWHGNGCPSRWYDKSIQIVLTKDGQLGLVGEHSMADGMPAVDFCTHIRKQVYTEKDGDTGASYFKPTPIFAKAYEQLSSNDVQQLQQEVDNAKESFLKTTAQYDLQIQRYAIYGRDVIKQYGFSPDAFVQQVMQLAGLRYFGETVATYESTQTRKFRHGRTETTRSVSPASQAFCISMDNESGLSNSERIALLRQACDVHTQYTRKALEGLGCDRHFLGLTHSLKDGEKVPDLFLHPVYIRSKRWVLSTSTLPAVAPGFGPVEEDGFGIGYDILPDHIIFTITAVKKKNDATEFSNELERTLDDMLELLVTSSVEEDGNKSRL